MQVLEKKNYHPSVDEIYDIVRVKYPSISLATVYRNVEQLCRMGKINRVEIGVGPVRYDGNTKKHLHIICQKCGKIEDVWLDMKIEDQIDFEEKIPNFTITNYKIEFFGICNYCKNINKE